MGTDPENCLGPFRLVEPLGRGGMGTVWLGRHFQFDHPVALKFLKVPKSLSVSHMEERFAREIQAVATLDHPGVVRVYDHGRTDHQLEALTEGAIPAEAPWMAMEYCAGGSLAEKEVLSWPTLRGILVSMLEALAHTHARGVLHRDLKPANVLFDDEGRLLLADFGLAFDQDEPLFESGNQVFGTPAYMAPEQVQGHWREFCPATDLFAIGCLGFKLMTGRRPFSAKAEGPIPELKAQISAPLAAYEPQMPGPDALEPWLARLLCRNPRDRFQLAADALAAMPGLEVEERAFELAPTDPTADDVDTRVSEIPQTIQFDAALDSFEETENWPTGAPEALPVEAAPPPLPANLAPRIRPTLRPDGWQQEPLSKSRAWLGVGLGLFGLRRLPPIGREANCEALWQALVRVADDRCPRALVIQGPAGRGKSHLITWFKARAQELGAAQTLTAHHHRGRPAGEALTVMARQQLRCQELSGAELRQHLTQSLGTRGRQEQDEVRDLEYLVGHRRWFQGPRFDSPKERYAVLARLIRREAGERPLLLVLEDGLFDADALVFADFLINEAGLDDLPLLILITSQTEAEADFPDNKLRLEGLSAASPLEAISLDRLSDEATSRLSQELLGLRGELAQTLASRAEGNPLFARQLLADWVQRGLLLPADDGFELAGEDMPPLPDDLHGLWMDRLSGEREEALQQLEVAAAIDGDLVEEEWLAALAQAGLPEPGSLPIRLLKDGLLERLPDGMRFSHGLLRESLSRRAQQQGRWTRWRTACADALLKILPSDSLSRAERVGIYLADTDRQEEALEHLIKALKGRQEALELVVAKDLNQRARRLVERAGVTENDEKVIALDLQSARLARDQGRDDESLQAMTELESRTRGLKTLSRAEITYVLGFLLRDDVEQRPRAWTLARESLEQATDSISKARALHLDAELARRDGATHQAKQSLKKALSAMDEAGDVRSYCSIAFALFDLYLREDQSDLASEVMADVITRSEDGKSPRMLAVALINRARLQRMQGDIQAATKGLRRALEFTERVGSAHSVWARLDLAWCQLLRGKLNRAQRSVERLKPRLEQGAGALGRAMILCLEAACDQVEGQDDSAPQRLRAQLEELARLDPLVGRALASDCNRLFAEASD